MKRELFRKNVKWAGIVLLVHIGAMIVFGLFFSATLEKLEDNEMIALAHRKAFWGDIELWTIFSVFYFKISSTFTEYRRLIKEEMKKENYSLLRCYRENFFKEDLWKIAILAAFQIPFMVFFAIAGVSYLVSTPIDRFYILEAGFYGLCGSSIVGFLSSMAAFTVIFLLFRFLFLALTVRSIKKY